MKYIKDRLHIFLILLFLLIKILVLLFLIKDRGWEPDSYMHIIQVRTIFYDFPNNLDLGLGVWEKPLYIYPFAVVYQLLNTNSLLTGQVINIFYFGLISFFLYKSVFHLSKDRKLGLLSIFLINVSTISLTSSLTALTEPVFTLCLIASYYFTLQKKYYLAGFLVGLCITARIEGFLFAGLFGLFVFYDVVLSSKVNKNTFWMFIKIGIISAIPPLTWIILGGIAFDNFLFLIDRGYPTNEGIYGFGGFLDFPKRLFIQETFIFLGAIVSTYFIFKKFNKENKFIMLSWSYFFIFLSSQIILWVMGQLGSAGLMRYLVSVIPFGIICLCYALQKIFAYRDLRNYSNIIIIFIGILTLCVTLANYIGISPLSKKWIHFEKELKVAGEWYKENSEGKPLYTIRPEVVYYSGIEDNPFLYVQNYRDELFSKQEGIYVWSKSWADVGLVWKEDLDSNAEFIIQFGEDLYVYEI